MTGGLVILSALGLAIWRAVGFESPYYEGPFRFQMRDFWEAFVDLAWGGVAIILLAELAELANRLTDRAVHERR